MKTFKIGENDANQRLDKFLKKLLPNASLSLIFKINRKNKVKIDSKRRDNEYKLIEGEEIRIYLSDEEFELLSKRQESKTTENCRKLDKKDIVFEDGSILVINKSPGIIVHPGDFKTKEISLIQMVHDYLGDKLNSLTFKPSLVHRIDKDTSGIIMIAKTKPALDSLLKQLGDNKMEKKYLAVTSSCPKDMKGTIRKKLLRTPEAKNENKVNIDELNGQKAVTHYEVIKKDIRGRYCLIECLLETGRMHQIRVHLASIGCPIIGDKTYGDKSENIFAKNNYRIERQLLHAYKIRFTHPASKKTIELEARLKPDMESLLNGN